MKVIIEETTEDDYPKKLKNSKLKIKGDITLAPLWEDLEMKFPDDVETPIGPWWNNPPKNPRHKYTT